MAEEKKQKANEVSLFALVELYKQLSVAIKVLSLEKGSVHESAPNDVDMVVKQLGRMEQELSYYFDEKDTERPSWFLKEEEE